MEILQIILVSIGSIIALFILTKLMGYRQISQLSMFDYIIGISIGSIAAEMATSLEGDFLKPLTAMIVYALVAVLLSKISDKSLKMRHLIVGRTTILMDQGQFYFKNMQHANMDIHEFLSQCRISGYFDLNQVQTAFLEPNGHISFLPKSDYRPLSATDVSMTLDKEFAVANVVIDGKIMHDNLKHTGRDEKWLMTQLHAQGADQLNQILLSTCDMNGQVCVYTKKTSRQTYDVLN